MLRAQAPHHQSWGNRLLADIQGGKIAHAGKSGANPVAQVPASPPRAPAASAKPVGKSTSLVDRRATGRVQADPDAVKRLKSNGLAHALTLTGAFGTEQAFANLEAAYPGTSSALRNVAGLMQEAVKDEVDPLAVEAACAKIMRQLNAATDQTCGGDVLNAVLSAAHSFGELPRESFEKFVAKLPAAVKRELGDSAGAQATHVDDFLSKSAPDLPPALHAVLKQPPGPAEMIDVLCQASRALGSTSHHLPQDALKPVSDALKATDLTALADDRLNAVLRAADALGLEPDEALKEQLNKTADHAASAAADAAEAAAKATEAQTMMQALRRSAAQFERLAAIGALLHTDVAPKADEAVTARVRNMRQNDAAGFQAFMKGWQSPAMSELRETSRTIAGTGTLGQTQASTRAAVGALSRVMNSIQTALPEGSSVVRPASWAATEAGAFLRDAYDVNVDHASQLAGTMAARERALHDGATTGYADAAAVRSLIGLGNTWRDMRHHADLLGIAHPHMPALLADPHAASPATWAALATELQKTSTSQTYSALRQSDNPAAHRAAGIMRLMAEKLNVTLDGSMQVPDATQAMVRDALGAPPPADDVALDDGLQQLQAALQHRPGAAGFDQGLADLEAALAPLPAPTRGPAPAPAAAPV